ncbi:MAG: complex I NDUFA9 subunit family protein, partial [Alphaproteobacteria bacterium]|nr:complex I NDUFA9 subunit family protein [Alphaproteobacteria bacterium]
RGLITVFGGSGFLGRYVVRDLLAAGWRVRVASRTPSDGLFLKPQGGLGQLQFVAADLTQPASVARAVAGVDGVINLVGSFARMDAVQHLGAATVAQAAAQANVKMFVHISAIGADPGSISRYGRSKGQGEAAARTAFPSAVILRPSIIFGREDQFINRFARMIRSAPIVPVVRPATRFQPIFAGDVARAITAALAPKYAGQLFELGGTQIMNMSEILSWIGQQIGVHPLYAPVPDLLVALAARISGWLPGAPITWDQWLMLQHDTIVSPEARPLNALGIAATPLDVVAEGWLSIYRKHGRFSPPLAQGA